VKKYKQSSKGGGDPWKTGEQKNKFSEFCPVFSPQSMPCCGRTQREGAERFI